MGKISIKGTVIGSITDIVTTNIIMMPIAIYVAATNDLANLPPPEMQAALTDKMKNDQTIYVVSILLGSLCSILGGYVAARIAKHDHILNGALASFLCVGGGIYSFASGGVEGQYFKHVLLLLSSPLLAAAGGYVAFRMAAKNA